MKIKQIWLLQATCSIILMSTTYATSTKAAQQRKEEVNILQTVPTIPLREKTAFGEKTSIKISSENEVFLSVPITSNRNNGNIPAQRQQTRNRPQPRVERLPLPTQNLRNPQMSRRSDSSSASVKNQLVSQQNQHDIPIVHKNRELFNKPITPTVGQQQQQTKLNSQQQRQQNANRSRFSNSTTNNQSTAVPTAVGSMYRNASDPQGPRPRTVNSATARNVSLLQQKQHQSTAIAKTTTAQNRQQHQQRQRTRTEPSTFDNKPPLLSRNANHNRTNQSSIVIHHRINSYRNNSQPLSTAASTGGSQPKIETSSYTQRGNTNVKQSVSSTNTSIRSNTRKSTSTSTATTYTYKSSTTATPHLQFQLPSTFNIFTPEFWQFFIPTTSPPIKAVTTTKKPPKKYKPAEPPSNKEEKLSYLKHKTTTITPHQPERIINNTPKQNDSPFRIALPTFNILSSRRETDDASEKGKRDVDVENLRDRFNCPRESEVRFQLFPKICKIDEDCEVWNRDEICCEIFGAKSCVSGIPKPLEETSHSPILGVIQRKCPSRPLAELWWEVKECETDMDCWPRVCCPDGRRRYCRTSQPELNTVPVPVKRSFNYLSEYLECTAPPPPIFDLHPKACTSTLDCFPNVCCQEAGLRHCRPPKKSVLTMLANVFNVDFVKRLTQNIVIK